MPPTPEGRRVQWVVLMGVGACVCTLTPYAGRTPRPGAAFPTPASAAGPRALWGCGHICLVLSLHYHM